MVWLRILVWAISVASVLTSGIAHGLGLGDITLKSTLSQPLDAEIELLDVRDLSSREVIPSLASPEEFDKAGVDRLHYLTDLKFTPVIKLSGKSVIRVTSSKPVQEPYLNFLVKVLWPNGRLLREYTVLLDPPLYSPQTVASVPATTEPRVEPPLGHTEPVTVSQRAAPTGSDTYRTVPNDTLWEIAQNSRADSASLSQVMIAFLALNPNAFVDGNINRLKSDQVLRIPTEQQMLALSQREALTQVQVQNQAWLGNRDSAVGTRQLDATRRPAAGSAPDRAEGQDNLRLVSGGGKSNSGIEQGDNKALADELAVTKERLDSARRENEELQSRMQDLQSQLDKLQKLIELKDAQLTKLQGELDVAGKDAVQPPTPVEPPLAADKGQSVSADLLRKLLANPLWAAAIGSIVLLALLLLLWWRNVQKEKKGMRAVADNLGVEQEDALCLGKGGFDDLTLDEPVPAPLVAPEIEKASARPSNVLGEADIYIAYGRFNQAAELLQNAIYDEPQRTDLRLKLLEVCAEMGNREGFARQEEELHEIGGVQPQVEQLKLRYPAMVALGSAAGLAGAAQMQDDLDDLSLGDSSSKPATPGQSLDDVFDLSLDDLVASLPPESPLGSDLDSSRLFNTEVELKGDDFSPSSDESTKPTDDLVGELGEQDLSLSDNFDLSLSGESAQAGPAKAEDSFAAQLDEVSAQLDKLAGDLDASKDIAPSLSNDDDFDFLSGADETATKLDLAKAYIDMGDNEGARDILNEVLNEGDGSQQAEARVLLERLA